MYIVTLKEPVAVGTGYETKIIAYNYKVVALSFIRVTFPNGKSALFHHDNVLGVVEANEIVVEPESTAKKATKAAKKK